VILGAEAGGGGLERGVRTRYAVPAGVLLEEVAAWFGVVASGVQLLRQWASGWNLLVARGILMVAALEVAKSVRERAARSAGLMIGGVLKDCGTWGESEHWENDPLRGLLEGMHTRLCAPVGAWTLRELSR
jgi:hypothetical protein